jgi:branched-subunit amino acid ABC-type transport system permease component
MLGVWMAGIGGAVYAPIGYVGLGFDLDMVIICFIIIIIGGAGNIWGCAISALIIGLVDSFGALLLPRFTLVFIYVIMAVVLITRPQGLLGGAGR